ncbi:MAG: UDP-N-acetylglucosamine diphosphorylase [Ruminococcaceae bacterium]|nr:UDP-N-acetylglucosamine diphosphorylase [Oscillospiraceae bacterium]
MFDIENDAQRLEIIEKLRKSGVKIPCSDGIIIEKTIPIGKGTVILPGTIIMGESKIGENCVIGPNSYVCDTHIGDTVTFKASFTDKSTIDDEASIGPFSQLRPNSHIGKRVKIGDFVEVKNSTIDEKTSVAHLTYIGDSDVGSHCNFGCGTVTSNYDGKNKFRTTIGDNVFIGCNTNLIAPVTVESDSYIAAGSTITDTVPKDSLAIARSRQTIKEGWAKRNREK